MLTSKHHIMNIITYFAVNLTFNFFLLAQVSCNEKEDIKPKPDIGLKISTEGNSWFFLNPDSDSAQVMKPGSMPWSDPSLVHRTYFRVESKGELFLGVKTKVESGASKLIVVFKGEEIELEINSNEYTHIYIYR